MIDPPTRSSLVSRLQTPLPDLNSEGLLVIPRLHRWFKELSGEESPGKVTFRLSQSGKDVLEVDRHGALQSDYLKRLAAHSLGIPWVAWHLWRSSLRREREEGADPKEIVPNEDTLWVSTVRQFALPQEHRQIALLVLQALLIHGRLTAEELRHVLPLIGETFIVAGLITAGFVEQDGDEMRCRPAAYPSARTELFAAGFPMDRL